MDLNDLIELLHSAARSVGAEVTSPWFYLQLGLILAGAGIAFAAGAAVRSRIDMTSLAMGWPAPFRLFMRVLVGSASTAVFAVLMTLARVVMLASTWPSRSYLLAVAANLAFAWLLISLVTSVIRNAFIVRLVSLSAWLLAALSIVGQLAAGDRGAGFGLDRAWRPAAQSAAADQARRAAGGGAMADQYRQQLRRRPDHPIRRPDAVDPGAAGQDDPAGADDIRRRRRS